MMLDYRPSHSNDNLEPKGSSSPDMVEPIFGSVESFETLTQPHTAQRYDASGGLDAIDFPAVRLTKRLSPVAVGNKTELKSAPSSPSRSLTPCCFKHSHLAAG
jgi:hypothetical protein